MPGRAGSGAGERSGVLVLSGDGSLARHVQGMDPARPVGTVRTAREALDIVLWPGFAPGLVLVEDGAAGPDELAPLRAAAGDAFGGTRLIVLARGERPGEALLREALGGADAPARGAPPPRDATALREGFARGRLGVRYQPIVRIADRRPVGVEALVRWEGPGARFTPDAFVPLAERSGLGTELSKCVARRAARGYATAAARRSRRGALRLSLNLPLAALVESDAARWLRGALAGSGLRPADVALELTETTPVRDAAELRRAILRLGAAGHAVVLDDMSLEEDRLALLDLPFSGLKLDRGLVAAMPGSRRARGEVQRLVSAGHARGMRVTAEGVGDAVLWRAVAAAGVDEAQGFGVGRPMQGALLPAWAAAWARAWSAEPRATRGYPGPTRAAAARAAALPA